MNIEKFLKNIPCNNVLDVCCGSGLSTAILNRSLCNFESIIGVDLSEKSLSEASASNTDPRISFSLMNSERLEYHDNTFDIVCLSNSLHHFKDPAITLSEMKRVLKPEGHILIFEMFRDGQTDSQMSSVMFHHFVAKLGRMYGRVHNDTYLREEIINLLGDNSLEIVSEDNVVFPYSLDFEYVELVKKHMRNASNELKNHEDYASLMIDGEKFLHHIKTHGIENEWVYTTLCRI